MGADHLTFAMAVLQRKMESRLQKTGQGVALLKASRLQSDVEFLSKVITPLSLSPAAVCVHWSPSIHKSRHVEIRSIRLALLYVGHWAGSVQRQRNIN